MQDQDNGRDLARERALRLRGGQQRAMLWTLLAVRRAIREARRSAIKPNFAWLKKLTTYLGMQVLIEGLALAAFQRIRDHAKNNLAAAVNAYVMQDEARHVTFGRMALREYYPQLSDHERGEREEFTVEALYFMRDRFNQAEVWQRSGLPVDELMKYAYESGAMQNFRSRLFTRIVPILKEIGLFGPKVQKALGDMGVMEFAKIDVEKLIGNDMKVADEFDARKFVENAVAAD